MKEHGFQFAVLRYVHDPITQEFINIGVALYSFEGRYFKIRIDHKLGRISQMFPDMRDAKLTGTLRHIESHIARIEKRFLIPISDDPLRLLLSFILPPDDSSLVFGGYGGGLACDLDEQLNSVFDRMVMRYVRLGDKATRPNEDTGGTHGRNNHKRDATYVHQGQR